MKITSLVYITGSHKIGGSIISSKYQSLNLHLLYTLFRYFVLMHATSWSKMDVAVLDNMFSHQYSKQEEKEYLEKRLSLFLIDQDWVTWSIQLTAREIGKKKHSWNRTVSTMIGLDQCWIWEQ